MLDELLAADSIRYCFNKRRLVAVQPCMCRKNFLVVYNPALAALPSECYYDAIVSGDSMKRNVVSRPYHVRACDIVRVWADAPNIRPPFANAVLVLVEALSPSSEYSSGKIRLAAARDPIGC